MLEAVCDEGETDVCKGLGPVMTRDDLTMNPAALVASDARDTAPRSMSLY